MAVTEKKYQLGTAENQEFLQDVRDGLLSFGNQFPSPGGSSYDLGDDGTPWKHGSQAVWHMCTALVPCLDTKAARHWLMLR